MQEFINTATWLEDGAYGNPEGNDDMVLGGIQEAWRYGL